MSLQKQKPGGLEARKATMLLFAPPLSDAESG
eukprot:CAMPEP_0185821782 /NCGR_PEP_ID=MMETSP1322-20130828/25726_1 /TAXON_ID=265543 /ORGANISM="Minutocellus polymorphus, Strain RCC2270" /LENGTH=31 /DNA_ID= /DNA_START= /DNA_END= /DNA_ORIENTATION=